MANDPEHSEIIETVVDVTMLEEVAEPDKKSSDAATTSAVEEADEEPGKMEVAEIPIQSRKMKEVIEDPAERNEDAATRSTMVQEKLENLEVVIEISSPLKKVKGFRHRNVDELQSYCANQWKSRNVVHGHGGSGFYKVPKDMRQRQGKDRLYDPTYINFSKIRDMLENDDPDVQTRSLLNHCYYHFLGIRKINPEAKSKDCLLKIYDDRKEIAKCYGVEEADLDFPQLLGLLLSGCFIIDLFHTSAFGSPFDIENDRECFHDRVDDLWVDLLLLENQIPFFILIKVIRVFSGEDLGYFIEFLTLNYFGDFVPLNWPDKLPERVHLLDFFHRCLLPDKKSNQFLTSFFTYLAALRCSLCPHWCAGRYYKRPVMRVIPTATRLQQASVQFRPVQRKGFVAEFKNGVLRLPRLHIRRNTEKLFINLIAWERCHKPAVKYVINFAILMDYLINTPKDVEILIQSNVLELSEVTEQEVADMFNSLGKDLIYTENEVRNKEYDFLHELSYKLNKFCERKFSIWWADLMKVYFSSPWTILSLIGALLLILLTLVQTFFQPFPISALPNNMNLEFPCSYLCFVCVQICALLYDFYL